MKMPSEIALAIADLLAPVEGYHQGPLGTALRSARRTQNAGLVTALLDGLGIDLETAADTLLAKEGVAQQLALFDIDG